MKAANVKTATASGNAQLRTGFLTFALATLAALLVAMGLNVTPALAAVEWDSKVFSAPTNLPPGGEGDIRVITANEGNTNATDFPTVSFELPPGVTASTSMPPGSLGWSCVGTTAVTCTNSFGALFGGVRANTKAAINGGGTYLPLDLIVDIDPGAPENVYSFDVTLSGGGAAAAFTETHQLIVDSDPVSFGIIPNTFKAGAFDPTGADYTQAGGHPDHASTSFMLNTRYVRVKSPEIAEYTRAVRTQDGGNKDVFAELPPGFIGNPNAVPACPTIARVRTRSCPAATQVGIATYETIGSFGKIMGAGIYNVEPPGDAPAQFAFMSPIGQIVLEPGLRSDGDYGLNVEVRNITEADDVLAVSTTFWGVPPDSSHDFQRCAWPNEVPKACVGHDEGGASVLPPAIYEPSSSSAPRRPFLSNPTRCNGQSDVTRLHVDGWTDPGAYQFDGDPDLSDPAWGTALAASPPLTGCEALEFEPTLKARPTTNAADSPTGLEVDLGVPQSEDPDGFATAHLKDTTVTLPEGLVINPSSANGLDGCSPQQVGLTSPVGNDDPVFDKADANCPNASKVGTVQVETPLLEDPVQGSVFVATPHQNPFGSLLAIYIVVDGPGFIVKIAGEVTPDPQTGRLTTVVTDNPQVPFEHFKLDFFGGAAASLKTPATCGAYSTTSELVPWSAPHSGPAAKPSDAYSIGSGPNGTPCSNAAVAQPNAPAFEAGSTSPLAGAYSPFVLNLRREDGSQQFSALNVSPPPGLVGKLAGTPACPDSVLAAAAARSGKAEQAAPSCPPASEVGSVIAGAGAGPAPYYAPGKAYLAGPYKGAPLSMAFVTPAVAGPFDLGTIVVRAALHVNPKTAQISAVSDPLPTILEGIPLDVRSVQLRIDKPQFTLNPTSCDPTAVTGSLLSTLGQSAALQSRFQVAECARLAFKPKLKLSLKGGTKRGKYPALTAVLTPRPGDANIASVSVALPHSEFLAQEHIRTVCTRVQFAADQCPAAAIYGTATVHTPLLDYPLTGPVYLRSSDNKLPDLVPDLRGPAHQPIKLEASGRTDSFNSGIRNTFDYVPDAPFTKLVLKMQGGKKGLLLNSTDICRRVQRATVKYGAHNGLTHTARPQLKAQCGKSKKAKGKRGKR